MKNILYSIFQEQSDLLFLQEENSKLLSMLREISFFFILSESRILFIIHSRYCLALKELLLLNGNCHIVFSFHIYAVVSYFHFRPKPLYLIFSSDLRRFILFSLQT